MTNATRARAAAEQINAINYKAAQDILKVVDALLPQQLDPAPPQIEGRMSDKEFSHCAEAEWDGMPKWLFTEARRARLSETDLAAQRDDALARVAEVEAEFADYQVECSVREKQLSDAAYKAGQAAANSPVQERDAEVVQLRAEMEAARQRIAQLEEELPYVRENTFNELVKDGIEFTDFESDGDCVQRKIQYHYEQGDSSVGIPDAYYWQVESAHPSISALESELAAANAKITSRNSPVRDKCPMTGNAVDLTDGDERVCETCPTCGGTQNEVRYLQPDFDNPLTWHNCHDDFHCTGKAKP